jgi:hypothetical protein
MSGRRSRRDSLLAAKQRNSWDDGVREINPGFRHTVLIAILLGMLATGLTMWLLFTSLLNLLGALVP